jgi:hypothetical protein
MLMFRQLNSNSSAKYNLLRQYGGIHQNSLRNRYGLNLYPLMTKQAVSKKMVIKEGIKL